MADPIDFYYDVISPNVHTTLQALLRATKPAGRPIACRPILFAGLLNAHGNVGPAEIPAKRAWMMANVVRKAGVLGIPLRPPPGHPFNSLLAQRAALAVEAPDLRLRFVESLVTSVWGQGRDATDAEVVASVAEEAGLSGDALVVKAGTVEIKETLKAETDRAIQLGVFGVPYMVVDGKGFWGYDDVEFIERHLRGADPLDDALVAACLALKPSAWRPQAPKP